jgi:hypothetical protein
VSQVDAGGSGGGSVRQLGFRVAVGQSIAVEIEQRDGARAVVTGELIAVPTASWSGGAMRLKIKAERIRVLPAEKRSGDGKRGGRHP